MSARKEIGAINFAEGYFAAGASDIDRLLRLIIDKYDLDESTASWVIDQAGKEDGNVIS